jgi:acetyl esterase/lipase
MGSGRCRRASTSREGPGPFPAIVEVHGGAWTVGDRIQNALIDRSLASGGLVVVALDFRLAADHRMPPEQRPAGHSYPAQVQDVNYAIRWTKAHAGDLNAVADGLGRLGTSSGGHTLMLAAMRPHDPRYAALPLPEAPNVDARVAYTLMLWAVLDPWARYLYARDGGGPPYLAHHGESYFQTEEAMREGNPQLILDRGEPVELPPTLLVQPYPDPNIPREIPERFVASFRAAGGAIELEWFPDEPHGFARTSSPETERALGLMKQFLARQLAARAAR